MAKRASLSITAAIFMAALAIAANPVTAFAGVAWGT